MNPPPDDEHVITLRDVYHEVRQLAETQDKMVGALILLSVLVTGLCFPIVLIIVGRV